MYTQEESNRITTETQKFISSGEMFTSIDIANSIKRGDSNHRPQWINNRTVANFLRDFTLDLATSHGIVYVETPIEVQTKLGQVFANLYHPSNVASTSYVATDQEAITPDEFEQILDIVGDPITTRSLILPQSDETEQEEIQEEEKEEEMEESDDVVNNTQINRLNFRMPGYIRDSKYLSRVYHAVIPDMERAIAMIDDDQVTARGLANIEVQKVLYAIGFDYIADCFEQIKKLELDDE